MSRSADSPAVPEVPSSPRRSLNPLKLSKKRSDRRLSINQETNELWNRTNSAPVPVTSSPGRLRRATLTAADASSADNSVAEKWKKNSAGSPAADKEGIKNLRAAYQAKKAQIMSTSAVDVSKSAVVAPPPPEQAARTRANTGLASPSRPTASNMAIQQARTSYDETDIKDRSGSKAMRAIKMLKRKSLAVPVRDLKDLKNFQGFGDFSEEEEPKTEVNVLVLGDATAGFCDMSHAIAAAQSDADELKARLVDRYMEYVRSQNAFHVRSDTSTTKTMELTFDNRPVALKIVSYDPDKVDPLTLSKINVAIVVFSVVVPSTLDSALTNWLPKVRSLCGHSGGALPIVLVGTQAAHRGVAPVSIPQDLPQGYAFAQTNECRAYFELSDFHDAAQVGRVFDEAVIAVASPPQQKEASIFVDSLAKGAGERLVLSHKSLTTATLSCLVSPEDRKAGLGGVRCLVLSHNHFTHLPAFVYDMPQLEELRVDNNRLVELDAAIGERLPNLRVLDLHNNELPSLPPSVGHMHFLHELNLNGNPLEDEALLSPSVHFIRSYLANPSEWTERGVQLWLERCGMPRYKQIFFENDIDGEVLLSLDEPELRECLGVADSDVRCLLDAIAALLSSPTAAAAQQ